MKTKIAGLILVIGIALGGYGFYQQTQDNRVVELGDISIERSRDHNINWMMIAGGVMVVVGLAAYVAPGKK